jgi:hypothetical protein
MESKEPWSLGIGRSLAQPSTGCCLHTCSRIGTKERLPTFFRLLNSETGDSCVLEYLAIAFLFAFTCGALLWFMRAAGE